MEGTWVTPLSGDCVLTIEFEGPFMRSYNTQCPMDDENSILFGNILVDSQKGSIAVSFLMDQQLDGQGEPTTGIVGSFNYTVNITTLHLTGTFGPATFDEVLTRVVY